MIRKARVLFMLGLGCSLTAPAQELYVYTEPASNMPAHAMGLRVSHELMPGSTRNNRTVGEVMFGLHKNFMFHVQGSFSDFGGKYEGESLGLYAKYRFLSADNEHSHFRGAAFGRVSSSKPNRVTEDLNLEGDNSGWQGGAVFTQLLHKLALSATVAYGGSLGHGLSGGHFHGAPAIATATTSGNHQTWSYSLSSGYLLFPVVYRNYKQPNVNLYLEALGQQNSRTGRTYLDLAPALQLILNSKTRIDLGYRFEVAGNMLNRHINDMVLTRVEFNFFNALTKK